MSKSTNDTKDRQELEIYCRKIGGSTVGLAWFNTHPSKLTKQKKRTRKQK